jgi:hypothetical protein
LRAVTIHKSGRLRGKIALFRAREFSSKLGHSPTLGWSALARAVDIHTVESGHTDLLKDTEAVRFIAKTLQTYL